jgi:hypothetical protein
MPIVWDAGPDGQPRGHPYTDTLTPKRFGNASPLDPALFASVEESVDEALRDEPSGRYTPLEVARWLEALAADAAAHLAAAEASAGGAAPAAFRRLVLDVSLQIGLGRFFAHKLRAGVGYTLYRRTGAVGNLDEALKHYRHARGAWAAAAACASGAYQRDLSCGEPAYLRGHWTDRLEGIDQDIADMEGELRRAATGGAGPGAERAATARLLLEAEPLPESRCVHTPPPSFRPSQAVTIGLTLDGGGSGAAVTAVRLHYRRVDQRETYRVATMERAGDHYSATIPAAYTASQFPLQYFFTLHGAHGRAWMYPGLDGTLANQPYFVVPQG